MLNIFMFLLAICMSNLEKYLSRSYAHFLKLDCLGFGVFSFLIELYELFVYFGNEPLACHIIREYFVPFHRLTYHFVYGIFCYVKLVNLTRSHLFIFAFVSIALGD